MKSGVPFLSRDYFNEENNSNNSMVIGSVLRSCKNIPSVSKKDFNLYELCSDEAESIKRSIELRDFYIDITVQTQYGGIITVEKMLNGR